jgi:hypothetical protein
MRFLGFGSGASRMVERSGFGLLLSRVVDLGDGDRDGA